VGAQRRRRRLPDDAEPFAWPTNLRPESWTGFRRAAADDPRPVEHVSLRELGNAMVALAAAGAGMQGKELLRETLAVFGGRRLTPGIHDRLARALESAVVAGRLTRRSDGHYAVP
jgi:hypothetical protein